MEPIASRSPISWHPPPIRTIQANTEQLVPHQTMSGLARRG
jgi:hypothetical protein